MNEEDKFYWHKKRQADSSNGLSSREMAIQEAERKEHNRLELERIRRQREEREMISSKKLEEKERAMMERERENLGDWEEKERVFHLSQAYQKVYIRVREGRARNLHLISLATLRIPLIIGKEAFKAEEVILLEDSEISSILNRIEYDQVNDALDELDDLFIPYEKDQKILEFWTAFKEAALQRKLNIRENRNISIVKDEVNAIFADKSVQRLKELREGIEKKLKGANVDTDYWTGLLTELDQVILKRKLDELYVDMKEKLKNDAKLRGFSVLKFKFSEFKSGEVKFTKALKSQEPEANKDTFNREEAVVLVNKETRIPIEHYEDSRVNWDNCPAALSLLEMEQTRNVGKDELPFNTEAEDLLKQSNSISPLWLQKYPNIRPRKPRFFNRVRMNYVWNKYNQTHYDTSNPPPKVVQGFRFNIFYPDLLQQSSSVCPTYKREADPTNEDNEIVRFSAGAPYADVIFRIPKEEWDMSSQHGFKCVFERGALRLHFWFRSQRYRR